jgi:hypothetical protein
MVIDPKTLLFDSKGLAGLVFELVSGIAFGECFQSSSDQALSLAP